jgi:hypothetical protein
MHTAKTQRVLEMRDHGRYPRSKSRRIYLRRLELGEAVKWLIDSTRRPAALLDTGRNRGSATPLNSAWQCADVTGAWANNSVPLILFDRLTDPADRPANGKECGSTVGR